jgi:hypothetical protein
MAGDDDANRRRPITGKRDRRTRRHRHASLHRRQYRRQIGMNERNKNVFSSSSFFILEMQG